MAKNLYETADDTLRGEAGGQLTPEAQNLWDRYNSIYGNIQSMPTKTVRLRSGATMPIMDPGLYYRQRALQKVLGGMSNTGLGTRNAPQPGALSQLAPFVAALGADPKFQKWLAEYFGRGKVDPNSLDIRGTGQIGGEGGWDAGSGWDTTGTGDLGGETGGFLDDGWTDDTGWLDY